MSQPEKESYLEMDFNYGILSKTLMKDQSIDIKAKAIYALLCTYAGSSRTAFPGVSLILSDLNISKDTYYKHMKSLKEAGYIRVKKTNDDLGKFQSNIYTLSPCPNSSDTENPDTENPTAANQDTNNNNTKSKSINSKKVEKTLPDMALKMSSLLLEKVHESFPFVEITEKKRYDWAVDIDKMNRLDGFNWEQIEFFINWMHKDKFYYKIIRSGANLRKHSEGMLVEIKDQSSKMNKKVTVI